ncbi:phosphoribosylamine--glycine ligase [Crocinitomicaceae bacterium]|nr:phosphoribosylamine--glycine ligase [Crocinitomicaceae bacterium]MDB3906074.1 phosphoribosylamine--glycine ligase [Crocinitomicaceae bacterium]
MRVLLLGSGGREHALAWKIAQSSILEALFIAPGNAGTRQHGTNVDLSVNDFDGIKAFVLENEVDTIVVGPEDPLVNGIADYFDADAEVNVAVIGPNKVAAQLEGSKDFAKEFMKRHNIPTAKYATFTKDTLKEGQAFLEKMKSPYVLKADGLAAGKGVLIIEDLKEAKAELKNMLADAKFGEASSRVVIEEFLSGVELSCFVITDGDAYKILPEAKDYKRIGEGDTGLNTGGMGALSPVPFANPTFKDKVKNQVIIPTVKGLKADGIPYKGFIFFGLINVRNEPYVIEYNCRMGDPETEVVIPRLKSDILDLFEGVATNTLSERDVQFDERSAATVMMVSGGYPEAYEKGKQIYGLNVVSDSIVFHAGTKADGPVVTTNGGRVLAATSFGKDVASALKRSYESLDKIEFEKSYYRSDIGHDVL